ncbi:MAG: signal recognition particle-docking protein FtsY [Deltaproteobacteria bacterium RIFOXYD12_FULL_55_16]|nr:MAG: signal recognition particle-docking protein FtsY [Deltaproteobacteria bacterium RIFOXYD12_FULL_55_16]
MLSWFKQKLGSAQDLQPEQSPGSETATPVAATEGTKASGQQENEAGFFLRLKEGLSRTRKTLVSQIDTLFLGKKQIDAQLLEDLEEILIMADIGTATTMELLEKTRTQVKRQTLGDAQALKEALKEMILGYLLKADQPADPALPQQGPFVVMVLGVNGVGKTTTIGKLAYKFSQAGQKVLLVAADTFRAAASEQLQIWGQRVGVEVVAQQAGADPSSVVFDALNYARPRNFDVVLVDTAGRLHTKVNLMEELKKIKRVMDKKVPGAPHEILLVLDATTGQNAISQVRLFNEAVEVTGLALTKLDGTAKGGIVINICHEFNIPLRFIGIGEQMEDLRDFEPREFVEALFAEGEA